VRLLGYVPDEYEARGLPAKLIIETAASIFMTAPSRASGRLVYLQVNR
jgi:hypothetical protein